MMIYKKTEHGTHLEMAGSIFDGICEVGFLISQIYHRLPPSVAAMFKRSIQEIVTDDAPTWNKTTKAKADVDIFQGVDVEELLRQMREAAQDE